MFRSVFFCFFCFGCITVKSINISEKTALENQLIGKIDDLTTEEIDLLIVRSREVEPNKWLELNSREKAIQARRSQIFHQDDLNVLIENQCVIEKINGFIEKKKCTFFFERLDELIDSENKDRKTIFDWLLENNREPDRDFQKITYLYHQLRVEMLPVGAFFEDKPGIFIQKSR